MIEDKDDSFEGSDSGSTDSIVLELLCKLFVAAMSKQAALRVGLT